MEFKHLLNVCMVWLCVHSPHESNGCLYTINKFVWHACINKKIYHSTKYSKHAHKANCFNVVDKNYQPRSIID